YFCSDRNDWWNLYRLGTDDTVEPVVVGGFEIATPQSAFGQSRYVVLPKGPIYVRGEPDGDALVNTIDDVVATDFTSIESLVADEGDVLFVGASYDSEPALYRLGSTDVRCLHRAREL